MPTFTVLDRKQNVLWIGEDHIEARHALQAINAEKPGFARKVVDERGVVFSTLDNNHEPGSSTSLNNTLKLRVPPAVWAAVRAAAGGELQRSRDVAREAIDNDETPASATPIDPAHPVVVVRVGNVMRDQLERRARARECTVEAVCVSALCGWHEAIEVKAVA